MWSPILVAIGLLGIIEMSQSEGGSEYKTEQKVNPPSRKESTFEYLRVQIIGKEPEFAYGTVTLDPCPSRNGNIILCSEPSYWYEEDKQRVYEKLTGENSEFRSGAKYEYCPFLKIDETVTEDSNGVITTREVRYNVYGVTRIEKCSKGIIIYFSWKDLNHKECDQRRDYYLHVLKFKDNRNITQVMVGQVDFEKKKISVPLRRYGDILESLKSVLSTAALTVSIYVSEPIDTSLNLPTPMCLWDVKFLNAGIDESEFEFVDLRDSAGK